MNKNIAQVQLLLERTTKKNTHKHTNQQRVHSHFYNWYDMISIILIDIAGGMIKFMR